ncbi:hypothetical protein LZ575_16375 [Antarcticibacterium sp. 1MA-6-2]|uniref:hypothetical protein n=1 Tax=Antarcticibacterium sp. 1MA-6-2 TaxID=2908210 RepID=UPI001F480A3E|nr:hypothetical protein [Antarcticibacterium sp. 1MA-6-2]UJH90398.1 hypothetical protein LZ575_16375 [Antarcticibacterium sp. 1MA-6-2]
MKFPLISFMALAIFLIILNLIFIGWFSIPQSRWIRLLTAAVFLGTYLPKFSRETRLLAGALISFLIADIFTLSYQLESSKDGYFIFHGIAFSSLCLFVTRGTLKEQWS